MKISESVLLLCLLQVYASEDASKKGTPSAATQADPKQSKRSLREHEHEDERDAETAFGEAGGARFAETGTAVGYGGSGIGGFQPSLAVDPVGGFSAGSVAAVAPVPVAVIAPQPIGPATSLYTEATGVEPVALGSGYAPAFASYDDGIPLDEQLVHQRVEITRPVPVPVYKTVAIAVPHPVPVAVPHPVAVEVPHPVPYEVRVPVVKTVPYPVEKIVPYPVEKPYPVKIIKKVPVPVPKPYPVHVPVYKVKHIHHHEHDPYFW